MKYCIRKIFSFFLLVFLVSSGAEGGEKKEALSVWGYNTEFQQIMVQYYKPADHNITVEYQEISYEVFTPQLELALKKNMNAPDMFLLDEMNLRQFVESGRLMDLSDIAEKYKHKQMAYPVEMATYKGRVYALSFQATPGALYYRRSLAKKYLGTDDPAKVQAMVSDFNIFIKTAETLKDKSGGTCLMTASYEDLFHAYKGNRKSPWIKNGGVVVDSAMSEYMDLAKTMADKGYTTRATMWSPQWFNGMQDKLTGSNGQHEDVFCYMLPLWGLHYVIVPNSPDTAGDWAVVRGPAAYNWGGSWIGAYRDSKNKKQIHEFMEFLVSDVSFSSVWAEETGTFVTNLDALEKSKESYSHAYVKAQNYYSVFLDNSSLVNGKLLQSSDGEVDDLFSKAVQKYVEGTSAKKEALNNFRSRVSAELGL